MSDNEVVLDHNEQIEQRRQKLTTLRDNGQAFPNHFRRDSFSKNLHEQYEKYSNEALQENPVNVKIAGRVMMRRLMGKASFFHLQDMQGLMQVYLRQEELPEHVFEETKKWDLGDIVGVTGYLFRTKTGELTVRATNIELLTKAIRPLPDKFHGLTDQETCYRQRYLDLIANEKTRHVFLIRSRLINAIREFLTERQYLEVETPMMQVLAGGAAARPFKTYHNALDMELFLRIAPELYLKRLVVGGFERVFEINRNFRNEGLSTRHNPEFTMIEFYQAYADYHDLMNLTEELFHFLGQHLLGTDVLHYQGLVIEIGKPFTRMSVVDAILKYNTNLQKNDLLNRDSLIKIARQLGITVRDDYGIGQLQIEIFEETVEHQLIQPTFITEYPTETSPLARKNDHNSEITDRFELFIGGREIANGFSELNDPDDQAERFRQQLIAKEAGDVEAMSYDEDYITALEHGLPPTAGEGIGIDRLVMLFTDSPSIRDVILFPHMRPTEKNS